MTSAANPKNRPGRKLADVWAYFMEDSETDLREFRASHQNSLLCPFCKLTVSHWGKVDRLKVESFLGHAVVHRCDSTLGPFESLFSMGKTTNTIAYHRESFLLRHSDEKTS